MTSQELTSMAVKATLHCLVGCAIGEVLGMILGNLWEWPKVPTVVLSIVLAFLFGYALSLRSVLAGGMALQPALKIVLAADTLSIATMEIVDNAIMFFVPGAMDTHLGDWFFWAMLAVSLFIAFIVTVPVNRWLIARGKGHAVMHGHHH